MCQFLKLFKRKVNYFQLYLYILFNMIQLQILTNTMSSIQKKSMRESTAIMDGINRLQNKQNLNSEQIKEMVDLLKAYQTLCIQRQDYNGAQSIKNKIDQLKGIQIIQKRQCIAVKQKQHIEVICKQGQDQIKKFQDCWDKQIQQLVQDLKKIEQQLVNRQLQELEEFKSKIHQQHIPKVKYSSVVLEKRKYLSSLIKTRNYKAAQQIKNILKDMQAAEQFKWIQKFQDKKKIAVQKVEKKQHTEMQALHIKLQGIFNQKIKQRDQKFQILLKKNRKRRIESSKPSMQRVRSRNSVLTESKIHLNM